MRHLVLLLVATLLLAGCGSAGPDRTPTRAAATAIPSPTPPPPIPFPAPAAIDPTSTLDGVVTAATLRVRSGPGTEQPVKASLKQGDRLTVLGRNAAGDWLNVRLASGVSGWVAAQYVAVAPGPACEAPATALPRSRVPAGAVPASLVKVIDGDTIDVLVNDRVERVRYIGVDTPERSQRGYQAATEANRNLLQAGLLAAGLLYLVRDISDRDSTSSQRLLRYVYTPDGTLVEAALVAGGWAQPVEYPPDTRFAKELRQLAVDAARQGLGFWSPTPPAPDGAMSYGLTTNTARVRQGPGTSFAINTTLAKDTPLTVFGRTPQGDWLQVRTPTRAGGWISAGLVRLNVPVEQVPVAGEIPAVPTPRPAARAAPAIIPRLTTSRLGGRMRAT